MNSPFYWDVPITVVGGQGTGVLLKSGRVERTVVTGPNGATYGIAVNDKDSNPITGRNNTSGSTLIFIEDWQALTTTSLLISGASVDGAYSARLWRKDPGAFR